MCLFLGGVMAHTHLESDKILKAVCITVFPQRTVLKYPLRYRAICVFSATPPSFE